MSSQLSHYPQEVLLAQFGLYVHKGWPKARFISFHFIYQAELDKKQRKTFKNILFCFRAHAGFAKGMKGNKRLISCLLAGYRLRFLSRVHVCLGLLCALCSKYC